MEIVKQAKDRIFERCCEGCGTIFRYNYTEINFGRINCPVCNAELVHRFWDEVNENDDNRR